MGERKKFDLNRDNLSLRLSFRGDVVGDYAERGKSAIILLSSIFIIINLFGQIPEIKWQHCYGTNELDRVMCISEAEQGYMIGLTIYSGGPGISNFHGGADAWILNINSSGNIIWERCYGGSNGEQCEKILKSSNNEFYLLGGSNSLDGDISCDTNYGSSDFWIVKINGEGDIPWDHCYGSLTTDEMQDAVLTPDGGLLFMGRIFYNGGDVQNWYGSYDVWFCKIDSLGTIEWEKTVGNQTLDNGISMQLISDTSFAFIGGYDDPGGMIDCEIAVTGFYSDLWLVEMSLSDGDILNMYCYGGSNNDLGFDFEKIADGYILAAYTDSYNGDVSGQHGNSDIWVVRTNDQGQIVWQRCLGGSYYETPYYLTQVEDGGFIVIGNTSSHNGDVSNNNSYPGGSFYDIWIVKLSANGEIEWDKCYGGLETERFFGTHSIYKKSDYNYVFNAQAQTNSGDVDCDLNGDIDAWVFEIDTVDTTGAIENHYENEVLGVYPNPAKDYVVFNFTSPYPSRMSGTGSQGGNCSEIMIIDILGQKVIKLEVKSEKTVWDCREVKDGIYFFTVEIEGKWYAGKVVVRRK